jgi:hypothetical protein
MQTNKSMTAFDHLYQHASYLTIKNHKERERAKAKALQEPECTFKPKILPGKEASSGSRTQRKGEQWLTETMKRSVKQYEERRKNR